MNKDRPALVDRSFQLTQHLDSAGRFSALTLPPDRRVRFCMHTPTAPPDVASAARA